MAFRSRKLFGTWLRYATHTHAYYWYNTLSLILDWDQNETSNAYSRLVFVPYIQACDWDQNEICNAYSRLVFVQYTKAWFAIETWIRHPTCTHALYSYHTLKLDSRLRPEWDIQRVLTLSIRTMHSSFIRDCWDLNEISNAYSRLVFVQCTQAWFAIETRMRSITRTHA